VVEGESFLVDTDAEMREQLAARLDRYIIADDVNIEDVSDAFALFHVTGPAAPAIGAAIVVARAERFGCSGHDLWIAREQHGAALQELSAALPTCDADCAEVFRIERAVPRWGHELTDEIIPTEANLEESAIDYGKGCYIGQEVISRIKMSGQTNKRLCGLVPSTNTPLLAGMRLTAKGSEGRDVGWVTSATWSARFKSHIALGFVKRGFNTPGAELDALALENAYGSAAVRVQVVALPFAL